MMMMMEKIKALEGKIVYIETNSKRKYTATIISVDEDLKFIHLSDKYQEEVWISLNEISLLQEVKR